MTFLSPVLLWSFLALMPLVAVYFLKVRPRKKPTTAYFLWERIFQEKRASSLFHRLRDAWSLLLLAAAASAICLALGRPEWLDQRKDLLIVIDDSASMSASQGRVSRLDLAKRVAREIVEGLNGNQRAAIATLGRHMQYQSHLTDNPRELLKAIDAIEPSVESLDLKALPLENWNTVNALKTKTPAETATTDLATHNNGGQTTAARGAPVSTKEVAPTSQHRLLFVSDGAFDAEQLPNHVEFIKVGESVDNIGIVAADMAYLAGDIGRLGLYYQLASTYSKPQQVDLSLFSVSEDGSKQLQKVIPITIQPGVNRPERFELANAPAGRWLASLDRKDALAEDNTAYIAVQKAEPIRVAVESPDPFFLENSIQAFSAGEGMLTLVKDSPSVVLAKNVAPSSDLAIIFQPTGESDWWKTLGDEVEAGAARVLVENHQILRHLDASSIPFVGARQITPPNGAQVLVADDTGLPLIYKARQRSRSAIVVNLDPIAAEFYFSAWFPVLVHSAVTHLAGRENTLAAAYRPGDSVRIPAGRDDVSTKISSPENVSRGSDDTRSAIEVSGEWFRGVDRLGFYTFDNQFEKHVVGCSLITSSETLLNSAEAADRHGPISRGSSPAIWLTAVAIVALAAESMLYHRRKVG